MLSECSFYFLYYYYLKACYSDQPGRQPNVKKHSLVSFPGEARRQTQAEVLVTDPPIIFHTFRGRLS